MQPKFRFGGLKPSVDTIDRWPAWMRAAARATGGLRRLVGDRRGTVAIEFAVVGGLCIMLIIEGMQAGLYLYAAASLENATVRATRQIMTGAVSTANLTAAQFRTTVLCPQLPALIPCSAIVTNIQSVSEDVAPRGFFAFVNAAGTGLIQPAMDNGKTAFCAGTTGTVIFAQVFYAMPVFSPAWRLAAATTGGVHYVATTAAFKNEPFQGSADAC